jgi:hypothetical protein
MSVHSDGDGSRQVGVIAGLAAVLFLVLLAPFVRTVRQVTDPSAPESLAAAITAESPGTDTLSETVVGVPTPSPDAAADTLEKIEALLPWNMK